MQNSTPDTAPDTVPDTAPDTAPVTACMAHFRFVPCRLCEDPTPSRWSTAPVDIELVRRAQAANQEAPSRFDEYSLYADIIATWGLHGAHAEVYRLLLETVEQTRRAPVDDASY